MPLTVAQLRRLAIRSSLRDASSLARAISTLGFVQADPIRAPARAQDLILRHRVADYRAGELERRFPRLALEEDFLYAYGFMPGRVARILHPRPDPARPSRPYAPKGLAAEVLAFVREQGPTHPGDLEARFGRPRAINGWGGFSKATTRALQRLHYHGLLRVARRRDGIRIYEAVAPDPEPRSAEERRRLLLLLVVGILAPISAASLGATLRLLARGAPGLGGWRETIQALLEAGALESGAVEGETYLWPTEARLSASDEAPRAVRFLAPFDPLVWDRRRFEHFWGWPYRFEAYTPPARRKLGYYAMPLLWGERVIGWVNAAAPSAEGGGREAALRVAAGFVAAPPRSRAFRDAFDAEVARLEEFLRPGTQPRG
jgi:uncharacterized protein YcaQ